MSVSTVESGRCVHSKFNQTCNGCRERELRRALGALVDMQGHGFTTPTHGLAPKSDNELWDFAQRVLEMTDV